MEIENLQLIIAIVWYLTGMILFAIDKKRKYGKFTVSYFIDSLVFGFVGPFMIIAFFTGDNIGNRKIF